MRFIILISISLSLISFNCGGSKNSHEFPELVFKHDKTLLAPLKNFDKLFISLPLGFKEVSKDKFISVKKMIESNEKNYFETDIISIYQHLAGQVIFISKVTNSKNIYKDLNEDFELGLIESLGATETSRGQFLINKKETVQFITTNKNYVNYKLFYDVFEKKCFLIDYFAPLNNFVNFQPSLESSISTISTISN